MWGQSGKIPPWLILLFFIGQFTAGAIGFFHEMLSHGAERPLFLGLSGALMGLPFALGADLRIRRIPTNGVDSGKKDTP